VKSVLAPVALAAAILVLPLARAGALDDQKTAGETHPNVAALPIVAALQPPGSIPEPDFEKGEPASRAARKVIDVVERIRRTLTETRYQHVTDVDESAGRYAWDCSGMAAWILRRGAPRALAALDSERPVARDFHQVIARAPAVPDRTAWHRLPNIESLRPGDLFAWVRPPKWPSQSTGHVGFVLSRAERVALVPGAYAVRVVDATSLPHQNDTRPADGAGGFGEGTLLLMTDEAHRPTAYGWYGTESRVVVVTKIVLGRL
jgi:hypothetical protein